MKKTVMCVFVLITCVLLLCSCVSEEEQNAIDLYDKYEAVINALEEKNYEEAVMEIYMIYQAEQIGDNINNNGDNDVTDTETDTEQVDPEIEAFKAEFIGEWVYYDYNTEANLTFTVKEDGTCSFGGKDYTWTYDENSISETRGRINVTDGREGEYDPYYISYDRNDDTNEIRATIYERESDYSGTSITNTAYNLNNYTVVELTKDNILDYFEYVENVYYGENAFGEVTSISISDYLAIKEEYQNGIRNGISNNLAIEITNDACVRKITIDTEARTYELGEVTYTYGPSTYITTAANFHWEGINESRFCFCLDNDSSSVTAGEILCSDDYVIERAAGTIYIYNK